MHELGLTAQLVEMVMARTGEARVTRVALEVGPLAAVLPDAMRFCFEVCTAGTPLEGASLEVREVPARARCEACGTTLALTDPLGACDCGEGVLTWLSGDELVVREVEVI